MSETRIASLAFELLTINMCESNAVLVEMLCTQVTLASTNTQQPTANGRGEGGTHVVLNTKPSNYNILSV